MPKKSNKQCCNGFYFFMLEYKNKKGLPMNQVADIAGPIWKNMSAAQKQPYNDKAGDNKAKKKTNLNEDMAMLEMRENEEKQCEQRMHSDIKNTIKRFVMGETIQFEPFHVMHINNFCRSSTTGRYYPAEIGLLRFSFENGVTEKNIYHSMIKPGSLPKGYALSAKVISEDTHKITPPCFDDDESNMFEVMAAILAFMKEKRETGSSFPPIYVSNKDMKMCAEVLDQMCEDFEMTPCFKVYSLEYLLYTIRNNLTDEIVWPTISQSITELERDVYDYTTDISCNYHESCDSTVFCSKSIVTRLTYILCDNCCPTMGIKLVPGRHIPMNKTAIFHNSYTTTNTSYASSVRDNRSSSSSSTERYSTAIEDENSYRQGSRKNVYAESAYSNGNAESVLRRPNTKSMSVAGSERGSASTMNDFRLPIGRGRGRRPV